MDKFILFLKTFFVANKTAAIAIMAGTCAVATVGGVATGAYIQNQKKVVENEAIVVEETEQESSDIGLSSAEEAEVVDIEEAVSSDSSDEKIKEEKIEKTKTDAKKEEVKATETPDSNKDFSLNSQNQTLNSNNSNTNTVTPNKKPEQKPTQSNQNQNTVPDKNTGSSTNNNSNTGNNTHSGSNSDTGNDTHSGSSSNVGNNTHSGSNSNSGTNTNSGSNSSSGGSSNSGSSHKPTPTPQKQKVWVEPVYEIIEHPAKTKEIRRTIGVTCKCGATFPDAGAYQAHRPVPCNGQHDVFTPAYETETVVVKEAWTEKKEVSPGYWKEI